MKTKALYLAWALWILVPPPTIAVLVSHLAHLNVSESAAFALVFGLIWGFLWVGLFIRWNHKRRYR